jgi:tRNA-specific 2-thiouridylase
VAEAIGIEHQVIDLRKEFARQVLDYYRATYLKGLTPNPCAKCNAFIKFGLLPHKARGQGISFDYFATGHYVRRSQDSQSRRWQLFRGKDSRKDQSYFLSLLKQEQLAQTLFPLGEFCKDEVRKMASQRGLDFLIHKTESQDFIQSEDHAGLFDPEQVKPGNMVDESGTILGRHRGLVHYTIGQRKGLGISGMTEPVFVTRIDDERNQVVIGPGSHLYSRELVAMDFNWLSVSSELLPSRAQAKIRQQHQASAL